MAGLQQRRPLKLITKMAYPMSNVIFSDAETSESYQ
jgi:hypothetical protein